MIKKTHNKKGWFLSKSFLRMISNALISKMSGTQICLTNLRVVKLVNCSGKLHFSVFEKLINFLSYQSFQAGLLPSTI